MLCIRKRLHAQFICFWVDQGCILLPKPMKHLSSIRAGIGPLSLRTVKVRPLV